MGNLRTRYSVSSIDTIAPFCKSGSILGKTVVSIVATVKGEIWISARNFGLIKFDLSFALTLSAKDCMWIINDYLPTVKHWRIHQFSETLPPITEALTAMNHILFISHRPTQTHTDHRVYLIFLLGLGERYVFSLNFQPWASLAFSLLVRVSPCGSVAN